MSGDETRAGQERGRFMIFAIAFFVSAGFGLAHLLHPGSDVQPLADDSAKYHAIGQSIERLLHDPRLLRAVISRSASEAERDSLRVDTWEFQHAPAYTVPLGLAYALLPNNVNAGRALSLVFFAATGGLIVLLGRRLVGRTLPWIALGGYLLYLPYAFYCGGIATEPPATFTILLAALLIMRFHRRRTPRRALMAGLGLAALYFAKTTFHAVAIALFAIELFRLGREEKRREAARLAAGALAPAALWLGFIALIGAPIDPLTRSGENALWLYRGNYVPDQGWETVGLGDAIGPELKKAGLAATAGRAEPPSEPDHKRRMYSRAFVETVVRYPVQWVILVARKFAFFWLTPVRKDYVATWMGAWSIPWWLHRWLFPLAVVGIAVAARRWTGMVPACLAVGVAGVHSLTHLVARYSLPVLPIWFLYALLGVKAIGCTANAIRKRRGWAGFARLPHAWAVASLGAIAAGLFLRDPPLALGAVSTRLFYGCGGIAISAAPFLALPYLKAVASAAYVHRRRAPCKNLWLAPAIVAPVWIGLTLGDPDWDEFSVRLSKPGDAASQRIALTWPEQVRRYGIDSAWVELDLLRSDRGRFALDVRVGGETVKTFENSLEGRFEDFLFDSSVHRAQARYRRVSDLYARFVDRYVAHRSNLGFDYFRRWVRVPVPLERLRGDTLEVNLLLRECAGGAWVKVFGDRAGEPHRQFAGPAIGENPFAHSSYRADFFAGDRESMDARLIQTTKLRSSGSRSYLRTSTGRRADLDPGLRSRGGEWRIRLRVRLRGQPVLRATDQDWRRAVWTLSPVENDVRPGPDEIRKLQWWRDDYFDGTWIL